jgi:hypothetical protein
MSVRRQSSSSGTAATDSAAPGGAGRPHASRPATLGADPLEGGVFWRLAGPQARRQAAGPTGRTDQGDPHDQHDRLAPSTPCPVRGTGDRADGQPPGAARRGRRLPARLPGALHRRPGLRGAAGAAPPRAGRRADDRPARRAGDHRYRRRAHRGAGGGRRAAARHPLRLAQRQQRGARRVPRRVRARRLRAVLRRRAGGSTADRRPVTGCRPPPVGAVRIAASD